MRKIICTRWIPASGKSTWTEGIKKWLQEWTVFTISKDDLRKELWVTHKPKFDKKKEQTVIDLERIRVEEQVSLWTPFIIVDNTHLTVGNKHIEFYRNLANDNNYYFEVKDFYVPIKEAIERDKKRADSVWEDVIRKNLKLHLNWWYPTNPIFKWQSWDRSCLIVDIDWTLAFMRDQRSPYDYSKVSEDSVNPYLKGLLHIMPKNLDIFILSWRGGECRKETKKWLDDNWIQYNRLIMRRKWDKRKDSIVKKEMYKKHIEWKYRVLWVFDDRQQVVDMWRLDLWLPTYQCWYGNF